MSAKTISVTKGRGSIQHNNREFLTENIDRQRVKDNIVYVKQDIKEAYQQIFGKAVEDYNAKQKRKDRKIDDYYEKVRQSKNGEQLFHEIVVQVGDKEDSGAGTEDFEKCRDVLDSYMKDFQERNPHIHVFNAVMHLDESTPHLHIDFIPIGEGYKRGLAVKNSLNKAMEPYAVGDKVGIVGWYEREREVLTERAKSYDIEITHKNERRRDLSLPEYKETMREIERLKEAKNEVKNDLQRARGEFFETEQEVKKKKHKVIDLENKAKVLEKGIVQELEFDNKLKEYGYLYQSELKDSDVKKIPMVGEVVKVEKYRELEKKYEIAVYQNEKLKMSNEFNPTYQNSLRDDLEKKYNSLQESYNMKSKLNDSLTERVNKLTKENRALGTENKALRTENEKLTKNLEFIKSELKETLNSIMELRKTMKQFFKENNLTIEFRDRLREVKFRWNSAVRRAIDFHENKDKDIQVQPIQKAIQKQSKSRGMER